MRQKLRQKHFLRSSSTTSTVGAPENWVKTAASSKTEKSDGTEW